MSDLVIQNASRLGLKLQPGLTLDEWVELGKRFKTAEAGLLWWLGDWINYGEKNFGDKYKDALEQTGYDYGTLRNVAMVARNIDLSLRRDKLTFAHHAEVSALSQAEQDKWLDKAEAEDLSRNELRHSIRTGRVIRADEIHATSGRDTSIPNVFGFTIPYSRWSKKEVLNPKLDSNDVEFLTEAREFLRPFAEDYERINDGLERINSKGMMAV